MIDRSRFAFAALAADQSIDGRRHTAYNPPFVDHGNH
jgi:hypothetical protein